MEAKEEVHSDDGSYELVNFEDYASETEHVNAEGVVCSSVDLSDDSSYDLLCSEVSDTLVLTEGEAFYNVTVSQDKSSDEEYKQEEEYEEEEEEEEEEEGCMGFHSDISYDSELQLVLDRANKGKKRDLMTMLYERANLDLFDFPDQFKVKNDIKEVAKNHITRYLPAKSLFKCRQVSKEWNEWISGAFFAHTQSQYFRKTSGFFQNPGFADISFISLENSAYGVPYPSLSFLPMCVSIKSSCNGLLLCQAFNEENVFYICNPANKEWIYLPRSSSCHGIDPKFVLAFEPSSFNFKPRYHVICLFSLPYLGVEPIVYFDIYDSETRVWRESDMLCLDFDASEVKSDSIFVNGVAYWETIGGGFLAFDLKNEIYSVQKLPFNESGALTNIHGEICYVRAQYDHSMNSCVLEVYGDGVMSLKNTITMSVDAIEEGEFVDCAVLGNSCDDVVALVVKGSEGQSRLYVYHMKDEKVQGLGFVDHENKLFPYVNSLVSIGDSY